MVEIMITISVGFYKDFTKKKLDVLTYKNTKFLFYRFIDLLNQSGHDIKVV